ncbi:MAG: hypothetical protein IT167_01610 [Bryobacterales bacterium]|nr:hypothetical protein [Bryobacterales bacterium]
MNPEQISQSTHYVWEIPEKPVVVHLSFDAVDRILVEVMRGFGAIPRRGAEVGGILLGSVETGEKTVVRVEDFEAIACEHKRGPSYLLSEGDAARYEEALARRRYSPEKRSYAVGCYRSHTREALSLSPEDLQHFDACFPSPNAVMLLVKPYATRVSVGGFFFREANGSMVTQAPYLEFPFRRKELGGGASTVGRAREAGPAPMSSPPSSNGRAYPRSAAEGISDPSGSSTYEQEQAGEEAQEPPPGFSYSPEPAVPSEPVRKIRRTNVWIPLSFIFLLLGVLVGFQASLSYRPARNAGILTDAYSISLAASRSGDYLRIHWDRNSPAVRAAQRAVLTISEGSYNKVVDLDVLQLQNPTVYYRNMSDSVRFRLEVFLKERVSVVETFDWKR